MNCNQVYFRHTQPKAVYGSAFVFADPENLIADPDADPDP